VTPILEPPTLSDINMYVQRVVEDAVASTPLTDASRIILIVCTCTRLRSFLPSTRSLGMTTQAHNLHAWTKEQLLLNYNTHIGIVQV
jgi:hypothetical protein